MNKRKIAVIGIRGIPSNYGGFETCAEETAIRYAIQADVYVFCRKHCNSYAGYIYKNVNLIKLNSVNISPWIDTLSHTLLSVIYILFNPGLKVVHLYSEANFLFIPILRIFGKKVVITVDGLQWKRLKWGKIAKSYYRISEYFCTRFAEVVVTDSRFIQNYYREKFGGRIEYIPYGSNFDCKLNVEILQKFNLRPREYLLFVGRLVPDKGVLELIQTYNRLSTNISLVIVGDDPTHLDYIKNLKDIANHNVVFLGSVFGKEYLLLNKYAYFYVSASFIEGTSPALVAAMGAGNCVLVNGISENLETIGNAGLAFDENNFDDLKIKMELLLGNNKLVNEYRIKAYQHASSIYNWDAIADQYMNLFFEK